MVSFIASRCRTSCSAALLIAVATGLVAWLISRPNRVDGFTTINNFTAVDISGNEIRISDVVGNRVSLIVNVASKCGFTPLYAQLESLYGRFKDRGFVVLGFPCNQFGGQEPDDECEIEAFATSTYGVTFPLFSKVDVNGPRAHPLWRYLRAAQPGLFGAEDVPWNFCSFLVDRSGHAVARYGPAPWLEAAVSPGIEQLL